MKPTLLALSPHLDDAAFSAGAALAERTRVGWRVVIATIFTASVPKPGGFALACQLDKGLSADVDYMALRRAEDEEACGILQAEFLHLPLREAPHRGYHSAAALFEAVHPYDTAQDALPDLLRSLMQTINPAEIWAPRALGGHVDHVLVSRAVRICAPCMRTRWWTDFPYADRLAPTDPEALALRDARWMNEAVTAYGRDRKIRSCTAYGSQLGFQFGGAAAMSARFLAQDHERYAELN